MQALSQEGAFAEAEAVVARAAPGLQRILAQALEEGGWFAESHADEIRKAAALPEEADRERRLSHDAGRGGADGDDDRRRRRLGAGA